MGKAVFSDASVVVLDEDSQICPCAPAIYRSDKDRLCQKLFENVPLSVDSQTQLPTIETWRDGVTMEDEYYHGEDYDGPYTFTIEEEEDTDPKKSDVIFYKGRFYVIGKVETVEDPYLEIEPEIIWVYPDWAVDNEVYSNTKWKVK